MHQTFTMTNKEKIERILKLEMLILDLMSDGHEFEKSVFDKYRSELERLRIEICFNKK